MQNDLGEAAKIRKRLKSRDLARFLVDRSRFGCESHSEVSCLLSLSHARPTFSLRQRYPLSVLSETNGSSTGLFSPSFYPSQIKLFYFHSDRAEDYTLGPRIGFGSSSVVHHATYLPKGSQGTPIPCALKILDLDKLPQGSLRLLQRETQLMSLSKHPNVLRVRGSWLDGHRLHIALRLMNAGSAADVMHYAWPGGMEEEVVRCILRQALEGLK